MTLSVLILLFKLFPLPDLLIIDFSFFIESRDTFGHFIRKIMDGKPISCMSDRCMPAEIFPEI